jgi:hypothetical protein
MTDDYDVKFVYWIDSNQITRFRSRLQSLHRDVFEVRKAVCIPLSNRYDVGIVPPSAWHNYDFCRRQFSWYHRSPYRNRTLVVSSTSLNHLAPGTETIIQPCPEFKPARIPDFNDLPLLIDRSSYQNAKPRDWDRLDAEDPRKLEQWLNVMKLTGTDFQDLFLYHAANHANFIEPVYFIEHNGLKIPYSIAPTRQVCSACLEMYGIIGRSHQIKLVIPCPGAVLFAGLKANCYYRVTHN